MLFEIAKTVCDRIKARPRSAWQAEIEARLRDAPPVRDFRRALDGPDPAFIFEIKRRSPANGDRPLDVDIAQLAALYQSSGASCISVLTEPDYFAGSLVDLETVRGAVDLPLLRKDFIVDQLQIAEARASGADAVLLIVALLSARQLTDYLAYCREAEMAALVEVHTEAELEQALAVGAKIIGVNNRNLTTLEIDLSVGQRMLSLIPRNCVRVAESGIKSRVDILPLRRSGADAFLIGSAVMQAADRERKIRELMGYDES